VPYGLELTELAWVKKVDSWAQIMGRQDDRQGFEVTYWRNLIDRKECAVSWEHWIFKNHD
jgi:hypothetical protein